MPEMPEREMWWLNPEEDGTMIVVDHPVASFPLAIRLVPESRLREVEAECAQRERAAFEAGAHWAWDNIVLEFPALLPSAFAAYEKEGHP